MADDDFDPAAFAAAKPAAPPSPPSDDEFDPNAFAAHKAAATAPTFGEALEGAVTNYPTNLYNIGKQALGTIASSLNPLSEDRSELLKKQASEPVLSSIGDQLSEIKKTGAGLAAIPELALSPATAAVKSVAPVIAAPMASAGEQVGRITKAINPNATPPTREELYSEMEPQVETGLGLMIPKGFKGSSIVPAAPPAAPPVPGADTFGVTLSKGEVTGDLPTRKIEEAAKKAQAGDPVYAATQPFVEQRAQELETAKDIATSRLSPTGDIVARTPQQAGEVVKTGLSDVEAAKATARQQALDAEEASLRPQGDLIHPHEAAGAVQRALTDTAGQQTTAQGSNAAALAADREAIRTSLSPTGQVIAANPQEAADVISAGVTRAEEQATATRDAAYQKFSDTPGSFRPQAFTNITNRIRQKLNDPSDTVILNDKTTPMAMQAIDELGRVLEGPAQAAADPATKSFEPFTPSRIDDIRKRLGAYSRQANATARATNDYSDVRAIGRVQDAFDETVSDALKRKRLFDGNAQNVQQAWDDAHAAHAYLRQTFSPQGKGDTVGPIMNKIVGQREGQAMPANDIERVTAGQGGTPVLVGRRLQSIFGPNSPEIGALKQSLWSKAVEPAEGMPPLSPEKIADNIDKLRASELARTHFTPQELARMRQHAIDLRNSVPAPRAQTDVVGKAVDKIVGANGQPATPGEFADTLFGKNPLGVKIAQHVKDTYGEDSPAFRAIQRGQLSTLMRAEQGRAGFDPPAIAKGIRNFLNGSGRDMANTLYSPEIRKMMADYADRLDGFAERSKPLGMTDPVDRAVARITGSDGKGGASAQETINTLFNAATPADKMTSLRLLQRLKQELPPDKMTAIKQGLFRQAIEPGPGENLKTWGSQNIVNKIANLYNKSPEMMRALFTPEENQMIRSFQALHQKLVPPQPSQQQWNLPVMMRAMGSAMKYVGMFAGSMLGLPHPLGEIAGYAAASGIGKWQQARRAKQAANLLTMAGDAAAKYQKALAASQRTNQPAYKTLAAAAGNEFSQAMSRLGVNWNGIVGAAAQEEDKKKQRPQNQQRDGGGINPNGRAHGGKVGRDLLKDVKPKEHPVVKGARLAPDGSYYLNDPNRPGRYLKVIERNGRRSAA